MSCIRARGKRRSEHRAGRCCLSTGRAGVDAGAVRAHRDVPRPSRGLLPPGSVGERSVAASASGRACTRPANPRLCLPGGRLPACRRERLRAGYPEPGGIPRARPPPPARAAPLREARRRVNRRARLLSSPPLPQRCDSGCRRQSRAARWAAAGSRRSRAADRRLSRAEGAPAGLRGVRAPRGSGGDRRGTRRRSGERVRPEDSTIAGRRRQGKGQGERRREKEKAQHGGWRGEDGAEGSRARRC